jgi:hypothetical protein
MRKLGRSWLGLFFMVAMAAGVLFISLHICHTIWRIYTDTPIGDRFLISFPGNAALISTFFKQDFVERTLLATWSSFWLCIAVGVISQLFHLYRFFYEPYGWFSRFIFWGLPLSLVVGFYNYINQGISPLFCAWIVSALPTLSLFGVVLRSAKEVLPEIGDMLKRPE